MWRRIGVVGREAGKGHDFGGCGAFEYSMTQHEKSPGMNGSKNVRVGREFRRYAAPLLPAMSAQAWRLR